MYCARNGSCRVFSKEVETRLPDPAVARLELIARQRKALIDGEQVDAKAIDRSFLPPRSVAEINAKYERGEVRIVTEQGRYPLDSIVALLKGSNYKLDPDYQRRHRWSLGQKSRLIESFIMNVPVPPVFLYEWDYNQYEVMDGLQRMTAVREFYEGKYSLRDLEYWRELEGMRYADLPSRIKSGIDRRYISSIILLRETSHGDENPERLKRFVFGRINTGGVKLSAQEVRNALYPGPMNDLCKRLSTAPVLRELWGIPLNVEDLEIDPEKANASSSQLQFDLGLDSDWSQIEDPVPAVYRNMTDVELVLRFYAARQRLQHDRDNLRDYLDDYLKAANQFDDATLSSLEAVFIDTLKLVHSIFGTNAFRRPLRSGEGWGSQPSLSIYDALTNVVSRMLEERDALVRRRHEIVGGLRDFYFLNAEKFNLRSQSRSHLMDREILLESYLRAFTDRQ